MQLKLKLARRTRAAGRGQGDGVAAVPVRRHRLVDLVLRPAEGVRQAAAVKSSVRRGHVRHPLVRARAAARLALVEAEPVGIFSDTCQNRVVRASARRRAAAVRLQVQPALHAHVAVDLKRVSNKFFE